MKNNIGYTGENAIPFDKILNDDMMERYTNKIMNLAPIKMEEDAKDILASYIYEIYQNSFSHSESDLGVYSSGFWLPDNRDFTFSIYDMGIGITNSIKTCMKQYTLDSFQCLDLAFAEGYSTKQDEDISRGLGLSRLEKFIQLNNGNMAMYTDDVCCIVNGNSKRQYCRLEKPIKGTLIVINIYADEDHIYIIS